MKRLDFVRWLVVVLGSWLMLGSARGGEVEGIGCKVMAGAGIGVGEYPTVHASTMDRAGNPYAGGGLTTANGKVSAYVTHAVLSPVRDDFNDNIKDPAKWGADTGPGRLVETNARLEYTGTDEALRPWIASVGSYTQNWEAVVDAHVGNVPLTNDDSYVSRGIFVWSNDDHTDPWGLGTGGDVFGASFFLERNESDDWDRCFEGHLYIDGDGTEGDDAHDTTTETASLRITFTANTKTFTAWFDEDGSGNGYSWTALYSARIDGVSSNWEMNDASTFTVGLLGNCDRDTITAGDQVYADNFMLYDSVPPYEYTVTNGHAVITRFRGWAFSRVLSIPNTLGECPITTIGSNAFTSCASLTRVTIPGSVITIGNAAFSGCTNLQRVYFGGNAPTPGANVFDGADNAIVYYLPGTDGWSNMFAGRPAMLWNPSITGVNAGVGTSGVTLHITGTTNIPIAVEVSDNLLTGFWEQLETNILTTGSLNFTDRASTNYAARFYRIAGP